MRSTAPYRRAFVPTSRSRPRTLSSQSVIRSAPTRRRLQPDRSRRTDTKAFRLTGSPRERCFVLGAPPRPACRRGSLPKPRGRKVTRAWFHWRSESALKPISLKATGTPPAGRLKRQSSAHDSFRRRTCLRKRNECLLGLSAVSSQLQGRSRFPRRRRLASIRCHNCRGR
jgi:hypothetical protein